MGGGLCKTETTSVITQQQNKKEEAKPEEVQKEEHKSTKQEAIITPAEETKPEQMAEIAAHKPGTNYEGKKLPHVVFRTRVRDDTIQPNPFKWKDVTTEELFGPNPFKWKDVTTEELFGGKKIVLLALPGAFTPTCSSTHLPGYDKKIEEFKKLGIDQIICLSVNDAFVMFQWAKHLDVHNIFMLPDGNGDFTKAVGMLVKKSNLGFGLRSWRYSMYVEDGVCKKQFIEDGFADDYPEDPFTVSDADTMLNYLQSIQKK